MNGLGAYLPLYGWVVVLFLSYPSFGGRRLGGFRDKRIRGMRRIHLGRRAEGGIEKVGKGGVGALVQPRKRCRTTTGSIEFGIGC
jgi:hypothetical protein